MDKTDHEPDAKAPNPTWANWGGEWHRLVKDGDAAAIVCGKPRKPGPVKGASLLKPANHVHALCAKLDALGDRVAAGDMAGPGETEPFLIDGPEPDPIDIPAGLCICGAGGCNTPDAVRVRALIVARNAALRPMRLAAFDAFLAAKAEA